MQVNFDGITSMVPGEVSKFFQTNGVPFFTRRLAIFGPKGRVDHVVLFADTEAALALPGEKEAALAEEHARAVREASEERAADEAMFRTTPMELPF